MTLALLEELIEELFMILLDQVISIWVHLLEIYILMCDMKYEMYRSTCTHIFPSYNNSPNAEAVLRVRALVAFAQFTSNC